MYFVKVFNVVAVPRLDDVCSSVGNDVPRNIDVVIGGVLSANAEADDVKVVD